MKIIVPAIGSRGDVQPYIALCQGLQAAGYETILATNPTLVNVVRSYHVRCEPVGPAVDMGAEGAKLWEKSGKNWWLGFLRTMQLGMRLVEKSFPDILKLVEGSDLVIATDILAGAAEAEKLGVPWYSVTLQPGRVPVPDQKVSLPVKLIFKVINALVMAPTNSFRKRVGAPKVTGGIGGMMSDRLVLLPVSRHVSPPDPRWPAHVHMTGYWSAQSPEDWTPPDDLMRFIEAGEKPVAVSLGAMSLSGKAASEAAEITLEAIRLSGVRAIVQGWDEPLAGKVLPTAVYHAGSLPHTWLFGQVQAAVHHGGFGTTASALAAGIPAIVVPHIIDQMYWGQKVHELGVGPKMIVRSKLSVEALADAFRAVTTDQKMQACATELGAKIRSEPDGVSEAVRVIEEAVR